VRYAVTIILYTCPVYFAVIFSLGFRHEQITAYLKDAFPDLSMQFCIEAQPLGTGGAIRAACALASQPHVLVMNGDTFFAADLLALLQFHLDRQAACSLCLKPMKHFDRYGAVEIAQDGRVIRFLEKQAFAAGFINGGIYALNVASFLQEALPERFSFEQEYLEAYLPSRQIFAMTQDAYFIDIGIPEDYQRAQTELLQYV